MAKARAFNILTAMSVFNKVLSKERIQDCVKNAFDNILSQMQEDVVAVDRQGRWNDITGNLTKSIIWLTVTPMKVASKPTPEGIITITNTDSNMIFGFLIAGMSYAINVELRENRDVLKGTVAKWRTKIPRILIISIQKCIRGNLKNA